MQSVRDDKGLVVSTFNGTGATGVKGNDKVAAGSHWPSLPSLRPLPPSRESPTRLMRRRDM